MFKKHLIITVVVFRVPLIRKSCRLVDWLAAKQLQALGELFCAHTSNMSNMKVIQVIE